MLPNPFLHLAIAYRYKSRVPPRPRLRDSFSLPNLRKQPGAISMRRSNLRGQLSVPELRLGDTGTRGASAASPARCAESEAGPRARPEVHWLQQEHKGKHHRDLRHVKTAPELKVAAKSFRRPAKHNFNGQFSEKTETKGSWNNDEDISDIISSYTVQDTPKVKGLATSEKPWLRLSSVSSTEECKDSSTSYRLTSPFDDSTAYKLAAGSTHQVTRIPRRPAPLTLRGFPIGSIGAIANSPFLLEKGATLLEKPKSWLESRRKPLVILGALVQISIVLLTISIVLWTQDKHQGYLGAGAVICGVFGLAGLLCVLLSAYDIFANGKPNRNSRSHAEKQSKKNIQKEAQKPDKAKIRVLNGYKLDKNGVWQEVHEHPCRGESNQFKASSSSPEAVHLEGGLPRAHPTIHVPLKETSTRNKTPIKLLKSYILNDRGNWHEVTSTPRQPPGVSNDGKNLQAYIVDDNRQPSKAASAGKLLRSDQWQSQERFIHELDSAPQTPEKRGSELQWPLKNGIEVHEQTKSPAARLTSLDWDATPEPLSERPESWAHLAGSCALDKETSASFQDVHKELECPTGTEGSSENDEDDDTTSRILSLYSAATSNEELYHDLIRKLESTTSLVPSAVGVPKTVCVDSNQTQQAKPRARPHHPLTSHFTSGLSAGEIARRRESNQRVRIWQKYLLGPGVEVSMPAPPPSIAAEPQSPLSRRKDISCAPGRLGVHGGDGLDLESERRWKAWSWAMK